MKRTTKPRKVTLQRKDIRALFAAVGRLVDMSEFDEKYAGGPNRAVASIAKLVRKMGIV